MDEFIPGISQYMKEILGKVQRASKTEIPVLLIGETGVGKKHLVETLIKGISIFLSLVPKLLFGNEGKASYYKSAGDKWLQYC